MWMQSSLLVRACVAFLQIYVTISKADTSKYPKQQQQILTFEKNTDFNVFYNV